MKGVIFSCDATEKKGKERRGHKASTWPVETKGKRMEQVSVVLRTAGEKPRLKLLEFTELKKNEREGRILPGGEEEMCC